MCTQRLPLPEGVEVTCATPAAGHLSSASIYPACFATYHVVTACSDNTVRSVDRREGPVQHPQGGHMLGKDLGCGMGCVSCPRWERPEG